jgi:hypothetical protein
VQPILETKLFTPLGFAIQFGIHYFKEVEDVLLNLTTLSFSDMSIGNFVITEAPSAAGIGVVSGLTCFAFPMLLLIMLDIGSVLSHVVHPSPRNSRVKVVSSKMRRISRLFAKR